MGLSELQMLGLYLTRTSGGEATDLGNLVPGGGGLGVTPRLGVAILKEAAIWSLPK